MDFFIVRVRVQLYKKIGDRYSSGLCMLIAQAEGSDDNIKLDVKRQVVIVTFPHPLQGAAKHLSFSLLGPTCRTCLDVASLCVQARDA
jgi:hypothetical protein